MRAAGTPKRDSRGSWTRKPPGGPTSWRTHRRSEQAAPPTSRKRPGGSRLWFWSDRSNPLLVSSTCAGAQSLDVLCQPGADIVPRPPVELRRGPLHIERALAHHLHLTAVAIRAASRRQLCTGNELAHD